MNNLKKRLKIYRELEDKLLKMGEKMGREEERIDWVIAINHMLRQAIKFNWDKKGSTYVGALKDLKKRMKATGIENLFIEKSPKKKKTLTLKQQ